jgi:hypothetical protein
MKLSAYLPAGACNLVLMATLFLVLLARTARGQSVIDSKNDKPKRVFIHNLSGFQVPDFKRLNTKLTSKAFLPLSSVYLSRGGGFYTIFSKIRLTTMFSYSTYSSTKTEGDRTNAVRGTTIGTSLGLSVLRSEKLQFIPFVGVVYSWFGVRLSKNNVANQSFANYLSASPNQQHLSLDHFTANVGLHVAATQFLNGSIGRNFMLGVRPGFHLPLGKDKWKTNDNSLEGGPKINAQGFYTHLIIGIAL